MTQVVNSLAESGYRHQLTPRQQKDTAADGCPETVSGQNYQKSAFWSS